MATGDGTLDSSTDLAGSPDAPEPVDHDAHTPRYFSLMVEAARETAARRPEHLSVTEWWQKRIHREWTHVNAMLENPAPRPIKGDPVKTGEFHAAGLARLAREVLMAAAHLGFIWSEGIDDPEHVEATLSEITQDIAREG